MNYEWDFHRHIKLDSKKPELVDAQDAAFRQRESLYCSADPSDWETLLWHKDEFQKVALGIHPWALKENAFLGHLKILERCISQNPGVHIGETGIDKTKGPDLEFQKRSLVRHLYMGYEYDRVVIIHAVRAWKDILDILKKLKKADDLPICMIHRFNGSADIAKELESLGVILSFGPEILDPRKEKLRQIFENYPFSVLESDGLGDEQGEVLMNQNVETLAKIFENHPKGQEIIDSKLKYAREFWASL